MIDKVLPGQPLKPEGPQKPQAPGTLRPSGSVTKQPVAGDQVSFRQLLDQTLRTTGGVKFSAHAMTRMESRGINLTSDDVTALEGAVDRAAVKGARDSLVLANAYALVVNVPTRTVITAFDQQGLRENVVTNIDSAVFIASAG